MSERPVILLLSDILDAIDAVLEYTENIDVGGLKTDKMRRDAVVRNIEIIGEAVNKLPDEFLNLHPEVDWHKARAMRNRLIHGYFDVDYVIVFTTSRTVLPSFRNQINGLLNNLQKQQ